MLKNLCWLYESIYLSICIWNEAYNICMLSRIEFLLSRKLLPYIILCWKEETVLYNKAYWHNKEKETCQILSSTSCSSLLLLCLSLLSQIPDAVLNQEPELELLLCSAVPEKSVWDHHQRTLERVFCVIFNWKTNDLSHIDSVYIGFMAEGSLEY